MTGFNLLLAGFLAGVFFNLIWDVVRYSGKRRMPPPGEAWCLKCSLNRGKKKVISPDGIKEHLLLHKPDTNVSIRAAWPRVIERKR
jgi:hypothetical protein